MKKLLFFSCFMVTFTFSSVIKANTTLAYRESQVNKNEELFDGVTWKSATAYSTNDSGKETLQNVNAVIADKDNVKVVNWSFTNESGVVAKDVLKLAQDFEAKNPGYKVLAGINGDYFTTGTTINANMIFGGDILRSDNHMKYSSVSFSENGNENILIKKNKVTTSHYLTIYNNDGSINRIVPISTFNNFRLIENQTTIFYNSNTFVPTQGSYNYVSNNITRKLQSGANMHMIANISGETTDMTSVSSSQIVVSTLDESLVEVLKTNPKVRIQKMFADENVFYNNSIGVGSQLQENGNVRTFEEIVDQSLDFSKSRAPRTSFGFTEDGKIVIATVDGRQTGFSSGVDLRELGNIMKYYGCEVSYNLDGGGSTMMVVRQNNELVTVNSPSDGSPRAVYNGLFIVVPDVSANLTYSNVRKTSLDVSYKIENINDYEILESYVTSNGKYYKLDNLEGTVTVTDLKAAEINAIDIVVKYTKDGEVFQRTFESKTVHLDQSFGLYEPQLPTTFEVTSEEVDNTLKITITADDLDELISKMALVNTTENTFLYLTKENATTWTYTYENLTANSEVKFNVYYETSINSNKNFLKDSYTFSYIGKVEEPDNTTTQNTTTQEKNENNNSSKCSSKEKISVSDIILTILSVIGLNGLLVLLLKRK